MSGLGLLSDYNNDSEYSEPDEKADSTHQTTKQPETDSSGAVKRQKSKDSDNLNEPDNHGEGSVEKTSDDKNRERDRHYSNGSRGNRSHGDREDRHRGDRSRDDKYRGERSRDRDERRRSDHRRDDRSGRDHDRSRDHKRRDHRSRDHGGRDLRGRDYRGRGHRGDRHFRSEQAEKEREYEEFRRRKYGDSRDWGKVSAESLKDVKTDATLPSTFDNTIAKQLAAQREKRKLLWGKKEEGEGSAQKSVWGSGSLKNDESGEQTAKFLKLMGVKDVTAENVKDYKKSDESVLRSSEAVDSMETEYEKSRYMQHINKGVGLGMIQFTKPPP